MINYIEMINQSLHEYVDSLENKTLREVIDYSLFPGGKRMRPIILLSILNDLNIDSNLGIDVACAVEMIHTYSLIHDDLPAMDNDDYRRGRLTVHKKYTEALAILAGDALLTDAFKMIAKSKLSATKIAKIISLAAICAGGNGMVEGQVLDIMSNHLNLSIDEVRKIHLHKTRDLIHLSIVSGAIIADINEYDLLRIDDLSIYFGLAFQIKDDIEDFQAMTSDQVLEKATYPKVIGLEESKKLIYEYKEKALRITKNIMKEMDLYHLIERIL